MATVAGLGGALLALFMYGGRRFDWQARRERPSMVWQTVRNKLYVDEVYQFVFTGLGKVGATTLAYVLDLKVIDGAVNNIGVLTARLAGIGRKVQTGFVRSYALAIVGGTVILIGLLLGRTYA
jgi:NADH-quinone oxidoreductase subunit L